MPEAMINQQPTTLSGGTTLYGLANESQPLYPGQMMQPGVSYYYAPPPAAAPVYSAPAPTLQQQIAASGYVNPFNPAVTHPAAAQQNNNQDDSSSGGGSGSGGGGNTANQNNTATQNNYATQNLATSINNNYNPFQNGAQVQQVAPLQSLQAIQPQALQASRPNPVAPLQGSAQQLSTIPGTTMQPGQYGHPGMQTVVSNAEAPIATNPGGAQGTRPQGGMDGGVPAPKSPDQIAALEDYARQLEDLKQQVKLSQNDLAAVQRAQDAAADARQGTPDNPVALPAVPGQLAPQSAPTGVISPTSGSVPPQLPPSFPKKAGSFIHNMAQNWLINNNANSAANYRQGLHNTQQMNQAYYNAGAHMGRQHDQQAFEMEKQRDQQEHAEKMAETAKKLSDAQKLTSIGEFYKALPNSDERAQIAAVNPDLIKHMNDPMNPEAAAHLMQAGSNAQKAEVDNLIAGATFLDQIKDIHQKVQKGEIDLETAQRLKESAIAKALADSDKAQTAAHVAAQTAPADIAKAKADAVTATVGAVNEPTNQALHQAGQRAGIASVAGNTAMNLSLMMPAPKTPEERQAQQQVQRTLAGSAVANIMGAQSPPPPAGVQAFPTNGQDNKTVGYQAPPPGGQFFVPPPPNGGMMAPGAMPVGGMPLDPMFNPYAQQQPAQQVQSAAAQGVPQPQQQAAPPPPQDKIITLPSGMQMRVTPEGQLPADPTMRRAALTADAVGQLATQLPGHALGKAGELLSGLPGKIYNQLQQAAASGDAAITKAIEKDFQKKVDEIASNPLIQPSSRGLKQGALLADPELITQFSLGSGGNPHAFNILVQKAGWGGLSNVRHEQPLTDAAKRQKEWEVDQKILSTVLPGSLDAGRINAKYPPQQTASNNSGPQ